VIIAVILEARAKVGACRVVDGANQCSARGVKAKPSVAV
jgi:hypothetical protein